MKLSGILLAVLPALVLAQDDAGASPAADETSTTTLVSTTTLRKTVTLSQVHTVTAAHNATTTTMGSIGTTSHYTVIPTTTSADVTPTTKPDNAGSALDATRVVLAGVAGMVVVAMM